ncbi:MAG: hypothetical protein LBF57_01025 [Holosporaceae bacterium]|jgi:hypothetical protein|nr:hypothetical protein [Holosporaceae bacterium]
MKRTILFILACLLFDIAKADDFSLIVKNLLSEKITLTPLREALETPTGHSKKWDFTSSGGSIPALSLQPQSQNDRLISFNHTTLTHDVFSIKSSSGEEICTVKITDKKLPFVTEAISTKGSFYCGIYSNYMGMFFLVIGYDHSTVSTFVKTLDPYGMPAQWIQCN